MSLWINTTEIAELAQCSMKKAKFIREEVNKRIEDSGYYIPNKTKAPRANVIEYLGIKENQNE